MGDSLDPDSSPLLEGKDFEAPSIFAPDALVEQARAQKGLPERAVPEICILDPDGDIVRQLRATDAAEKDDTWPGYHTDLYRFERDGEEYGIVGCAVGASFAVLVAEQLFAAGCDFLISITSAGQITPKDDPPYFVLIDRALRDEGTSHHYRAPARYATLDTELASTIEDAASGISRPVYTGASWTTDAPFRETQTAIETARAAGILAVEMEAAALYTFATVRDRPVACFAHVTNQMGQTEQDFEKGEADGSQDALEVVAATTSAWRALE